MEGLTRLVSESMARHGVDCSLDYRRLHWSSWFPCETSFDLLLVPSRPGLFAIGEELMAPGESAAGGGKRMLAVLQVSASDDLATALSRLFAPNSAWKDRLASSRLFARHTVIEDAAQRRTAEIAFQHWLTTAAEAAAGGSNDWSEVVPFVAPRAETELESPSASVHPPAPLPSGF